MKKILIITPNCPFPPHKSGGTHALYNIIKNKIEDDYLDLLYYDDKDIEAEKELNKYVNNVIYCPIKKNINIFNRLISIIKRVPYGIFQYDSKKLKITKEYDLIIFDQNLSMNLIEKSNCSNNILMAYDSMQLFFERKAKLSSKFSVENIYNLLQSKFYKNIKSKIYSRFDKVYFVSNLDAEYESKIHSQFSEKIDFVNLGVDHNKFNIENYKINSNEKSIIFTGIMDYGPNKDAAIFFAKEVMPILLSKYPELKFYIVGKNPDKEIKQLNSKNIIVTGFVDDIVKCIAEATVYVSPLRFGTGMKNKILEAMSTSKPIVASKVSIEGIDELIHNENIFEANNVNDWVKYISYLFEDDLKREEFSIRCRECILKNYSWEKAYNKLIE